MKTKFIKAYANIAKEIASLSHSQKLKVGAIIVKEGRILSMGYNGMPAGWDNVCEAPVYEEGEHEPHVWYETRPEVLHAESNALMKVAASTESSQGATMFCTHTPCIECAKLIHQAGIAEVYVGSPYVASKGTGVDFLHQCGIAVYDLVDFSD
jgi:dCMP deaminase